MTSVRIAVPDTVRAGAVIEIKTLITHPMESGFRRDAMGNAIARNILTEFECRYLGRTAFKAELKPGVAANPFLSFFVRVETTGTLDFVWSGQNDFVLRESREIVVLPG